MTQLAIGLAALGRPAYINLGRSAALPAERTVAAMRDASFAVLDHAYAEGIRWVDAARSYGRSEEFLADWLAEREYEDVTVSSKWGYSYVGDWRMDADTHEVKEHSLEQLRAQLRESRRLLGERLALYQVHSLTAESPLFTDTALLEELAALAEDGVRIGCSTSGPRQAETIRRALELEVDGRRLFDSIQASWNLLEPSAGDALSDAHESGVLVMIKEPLANGRLAVEPPEQLRRAAERARTGTDAVALSVAMSRPWADVVLLGPANTAQLDNNLRARGLEVAVPEDPAEEPEYYWSRRGRLAWT